MFSTEQNRHMRKIISLVVIITFIFQSSGLLFTQGITQIRNLFEEAKKAYLKPDYQNAQNRLELAIAALKKTGVEGKEKFLGKCHLLLGVVFERKGDSTQAKANYKKAKENKVETIEGIKLDVLVIYKKVIKPELYIKEQFQKAKVEYFAEKPKYADAGNTLTQLIDFINNSYLKDKIKNEHLGKCYLLLGASYEKLGDNDNARENYRKEYGVSEISGVDMSKLPIYNFEIAKAEYKKGKVDDVIKRLKGLISSLDEKKFEDKKLLSKIYLLLAAAYEKKEKIKEAKKYYKKSCEKWRKTHKNQKNEKVDPRKPKKGVIQKRGEKPNRLPPIEKIDFNGLKYYTKYNKKCSRFPVLLVAAGVVAVAALVYFLVIKPKKKTYTLTVNVGEGVTGNPAAGPYTYKEGETVNYNYSLQSGYSNLLVQKNGVEVPDSGIITMDKDYTLTATADELLFITDLSEVTVPEGRSATFQVKLSSQPSSTVNATVGWVSGDNDITVQAGSSLTFTTSNWNSYQTVTLAARDDTDNTNGTAAIRIRDSASHIPDKEITAVEDDNLETSLTLNDRDGYDFSQETKTSPSAGDFYCDKYSGQIRFLANYPGQEGLRDMGNYSEYGPLKDGIIPDSVYSDLVIAVENHVYVAKAREYEYYIVFRVTNVNINSGSCSINWIYKENN
ncbi:MAG: tetratricopeptide repeat protein [Candidatus Aminicenantes bacterium]|nr:tetratricopeptide repeat protein [Candidatus Aminicenantes bacterium]